ncbi:hypothetical protein L7F22_026418 [Adiantum nelumboides]|nr:hypothetical protein [Adiantum nelumboides]
MNAVRAIHLEAFFRLPPRGTDDMQAHELMSSIQYDGQAMLMNKDGSKVRVQMTKDIINEALHFYLGQHDLLTKTKSVDNEKAFIKAKGPMLTRIAYQALGMIKDLPAANSQAALIQNARLLLENIQLDPTPSSPTPRSPPPTSPPAPSSTQPQAQFAEGISTLPPSQALDMAEVPKQDSRDEEKDDQAKADAPEQQEKEQGTRGVLEQHPPGPPQETMQIHMPTGEVLEPRALYPTSSRGVAVPTLIIQTDPTQEEAYEAKDINQTLLNKEKEEMGSQAQPTQTRTAKTHIHVQLPPMPGMPDLPGTLHQEEEGQEPAPRALDVRAKLTQSIEDIPEGPAKDFMLYEIKDTVGSSTNASVVFSKSAVATIATSVRTVEDTAGSTIGAGVVRNTTAATAVCTLPSTIEQICCDSRDSQAHAMIALSIKRNITPYICSARIAKQAWDILAGLYNLVVTMVENLEENNSTYTKTLTNQARIELFSVDDENEDEGDEDDDQEKDNNGPSTHRRNRGRLQCFQEGVTAHAHRVTCSRVWLDNSEGLPFDELYCECSSSHSVWFSLQGFYIQAKGYPCEQVKVGLGWVWEWFALDTSDADAVLLGDSTSANSSKSQVGTLYTVPHRTTQGSLLPLYESFSTSLSKSPRRIGSRSKMSDPYWRYVTKLAAYGGGRGSKKWRCNFCGIEKTGSVTRVKDLLGHVLGKDIEPCASVPDDVKSGLAVWRATRMNLCNLGEDINTEVDTNTSQSQGEASSKRCRRVSPSPTINVDKIDIEKMRDIPDISQEERDLYALLYEEAIAPVHDTRRRERRRGRQPPDVGTSAVAGASDSSSSASSEESHEDQVDNETGDDTELSDARAYIMIHATLLLPLVTSVFRVVFLDLPGLLFFSTYTLLVLFWAEIYHQARSLPTEGLRPIFLVFNGIVYTIQVCIWLAEWITMSEATTVTARLFLAVISIIAALGFLTYGGRLFLVLRRFPIESKGRQKKLREVGSVTAICFTCFLIRAVVAAGAAFNDTANVDSLYHPILNLFYYVIVEIIPAALVLFILRKLPPKRVTGHYHAIR